MEINLQKWAEFESSNPTAGYTNAIINESIVAYLSTPEVDTERLEPFFPVYRSLQEIGIVSDIPELEEIDDPEFRDSDDEEEEDD